MGKLSDDKFFGKIYYDKSEDELHKIIEEKLSTIANSVARHIIMDWRPVQDADPYDPNPSRLGEHDLITICEFLQRYTTEDWAEVFLLKFVQYINEIKNTGGWTQMRRAWPTDERKDDPSITSRREEDGSLLFKDKADHEQWLLSQERKNLITDALGDRGIGDDNYKKTYWTKKKRNGVGHA